jgi:hypothetical protein
VQILEITLLGSAVAMTLPMVAWMRFRGMDRRSLIEMSGGMLVAAMLIIGGYWLGLLDNVPTRTSTSLVRLQHSLMVPAMLLPMLLRLDYYTSHVGHKQAHTEHAEHAVPAYRAAAARDAAGAV